MVPAGFLLDRPGADSEEELHHRGIHIGRDGSILMDASWVYCLCNGLSLEERVQQIDYFHGIWGGMPVAQTMADEIDIRAADMIAIGTTGFVAKRLAHLQLRFRKRRAAKKYEQRMLEMGLVLARSKHRARDRINT